MAGHRRGEFLLVEHGPRQASAEIGQDLESDGIFEPAADFKLNLEAEKTVAEAKEFVAEAFKTESGRTLNQFRRCGRRRRQLLVQFNGYGDHIGGLRNGREKSKVVLRHSEIVAAD